MPGRARRALGVTHRLEPHGRVRFKAEEGMQSLVAENFMRVVGTHIYRAKVQKIAHFPQASYFLYSVAYFYHPESGFGNWISSFVYLRQIIINHV
jgi:hypothetical protein